VLVTPSDSQSRGDPDPTADPIGRLPRWRRVSVSILVITAACALAKPGVGSASTTFGDSLGVPESLIQPYTLCDEPCTLSTTVSPERLAYFRAPASGTIVRWRIQTIAGSSSQQIALRVLAPVAGDEFDGALDELFTGAGTSEAVAAPTTTGTFTFSTRLPVTAGDFIGLDTEGKPLAAVAVEEESIRMFEPPLTDFGAASSGEREDYALLVNADVATPPTASAIPACSRSGQFGVTVTPDPDPAVGAKALHARVDGGPETVLPVVGTPAVASIAAPFGAHTVEYWGEDTLGQQESPHRVASVLVDDTPPTVTISSDQDTASYTQGERASITVDASDPLAGLVTNPSAPDETIATGTPGRFSVTRTATDACGNTASASFAYLVTPAAHLTALRMRPASFRAARSGPATTAPRGRPRAGASGAEVSYTDSDAAVARFTIQRRELGSLVNGSCERQRAARGRRPCELFVDIGGFTRSDRAGVNRFHLTGRIDATTLAPGAYRLVIVASVPGGEAGSPAYAAFQILAR
jgi:hypothetical protein